MKRSVLCVWLSLTAVLAAVSASAEMLDRPTGVKIGQRMTLRPYVSLSFSWDSNVRSRNANEDDDIVWAVNPGFGLDYRAENWSLLLNGYYNYFAYTKSRNQSDLNQHSFGENLRWNWENTRGGERGWAVMLSQSFRQVNMADDMTFGDSRGYSSDRREFDFSGGVRRNFNEHWHANGNAGYYFLQYDNDLRDSVALFGWQRWMAGLDGGFAPSRWTDIVLSGNYQGYDQDNVEGTPLSRNSQGYSLQGGIGTFATERISYRLLVGWSRFEYANRAATSDGFVYTITGNWKISETLHTMLLATSYYQPSEREYASRSRVDSVSWGIAKSLVRGKLSTTFDVAYRHETQERVAEIHNRDYELDIVTARLSLNYTLNRYLGLFCAGEYQQSWNDESEREHGFNDYSRWRLTGGLRLTY